MNTLVVVLGPTCVGKTDLCIQIAKHLNISIINADSRQIYAELPIGTAAPTFEDQQQAFHYFVGNHKIQDYYSASLFESDVISLLEDKLFKENHVAMMCGGSMMYIDAVCYGIDDIPTVDEQTRSFMKQQLQEKGLSELVEELRRVDPKHYEIVDKNNPRRVIHALEICHMTGKTYSSFRTNTKRNRPFRIIKIGLNRNREIMYQRINDRVLTMMDQGLEQEAKKVYPYKGLNALNTVGYKELFDYFECKISQEEAIRQIQSNTRRYMRKQLTWFKKDENIQWFHPDNIKEIINYIDKTIKV